MKALTLTPAYGRDYKNAADVKKDFNDDKDFIVSNFFSPYDGKSANKSDLKSETVSAYSHVNIRYNKLMKIVVIKL